MRGRVLRVSGLQCLVDVGTEEWRCELRGKLKLGTRVTNAPVVTGDLVEVAAVSEKVGVVESVYPRHSLFSRLSSGSRPSEQLLAANIDTLVAMVSLHNPSPRVGFIDRAIVMALKGNIQPAICINKHDLLGRWRKRVAGANLSRPRISGSSHQRQNGDRHRSAEKRFEGSSLRLRGPIWGWEILFVEQASARPLHQNQYHHEKT